MKTPDPELLARIEAVLIQQLQQQLDDAEEGDDVQLAEMLLEHLGPKKPEECFGIQEDWIARGLMMRLFDDDRGPDLAAYLIDIVKGYGAWGGHEIGRIAAVTTALQALAWQKAYALACTFDPKLYSESTKPAAVRPDR